MADYIGTTGDDQYAGGDADDNIVGDDGADTLSGRGGSDVILGAMGDDRLNGETGADSLAGGDGADTLISIDSGPDSLDGGAGNDLLTIFQAAQVWLGAGGDTVEARGDGPIVINDFTPGAGGDVIDLQKPFTAGSSDLFGSGYARLQQVGSDTVLSYLKPDFQIAGAGHYIDLVVFKNTNASAFTSDNFYSAGVGALTPREAYDNGLVVGTDFSEVRRAGGGDDTLQGRGGDDILSGGGGRDVLDGGAGADTLTGGAGADRFVVTAGDLITDFSPAEDRIDLSADPSIHNYTQAMAHAFLTGPIGNRSTGFFLGSDGTFTVDSLNPGQFHANNFVYVGGATGTPDDVNRDGVSDILWRNAGGLVGPWTLGAQVSTGGTTGFAAPGWVSQGRAISIATGPWTSCGATGPPWASGSWTGTAATGAWTWVSSAPTGWSPRPATSTATASATSCGRTGPPWACGTCA